MCTYWYISLEHSQSVSVCTCHGSRAGCCRQQNHCKQKRAFTLDSLKDVAPGMDIISLQHTLTASILHFITLFCTNSLKHSKLYSFLIWKLIMHNIKDYIYRDALFKYYKSMPWMKSCINGQCCTATWTLILRGSPLSHEGSKCINYDQVRHLLHSHMKIHG